MPPYRFNLATAARAACLPLLLAFVAGCNHGPVAQGPGAATGTKVKVALFVPAGSSDLREENLAWNLVQAAELAVGNLEDPSLVELGIFPTAGDPETAIAAVQEAKEQGASIILGPMFSKVAKAVGPEAAKHGLSVLSFSNDTSIAGDNVFLLGTTFETRADRLVAYAMSRGLERIAIVAAQDRAGELAKGAVTSAATTMGATIVSIATYEKTRNGPIEAVPSIKRSILESEAQAIILDAVTSNALPVFADLLPENGPDPKEVQYIGLARWDIPAAILRRDGLQGGWFVRPDPVHHAPFVNDFTEAYGQRPHPLAGLAYDGITAIGALARRGDAKPLSARNIARPDGFPGVLGKFRLNRDGTISRNLAVAEIRDGQVRILLPSDAEIAPLADSEVQVAEF